jgi:glutaminyl-tRNA synthetase
LDKSKDAKHGGAHVTNFVRNIIDHDLASGKHKGVVTRFPPEPNGYLHIGHAKSICLNFGIARDYGGKCFLRFDDTNPENENLEFMESIKDAIRWLGFDWGDRLRNASDYFEQLYGYAVQLIKEGKAFVCDLDSETLRGYRGSLTEGGKESPFRGRSVAENLDLFQRMRVGEFPDGSRTLRVKIDMSSGNINLRDPAIYRIKRFNHHLLGDEWCIYPMYDYAHCISDAIEGITHSLCTLEFEDHRPLYDWILNELKTPCHPQQIEFSRLELNYTVTSKRKLKKLVEDGLVDGWDDPRLPTIAGIRRRGYTPNSVRLFCDRIGLSKKKTVIDMSVLEDCVREDLNEVALRAFAVLDPIQLVIENYPEASVEQLSVPNHPQKPELGMRLMPFSRELLIEREDFMENPPSKYFRLAPGQEVRLRYGYIVRCDRVEKNSLGEVTKIFCTYDPETLGKNPVGRKVKGIIHWVSEKQSLPAVVREYDRLFVDPNPGAHMDTEFVQLLNKNSLRTVSACRVEPGLAQCPRGQQYQFERLGYFCRDSKEGTDQSLVFNRIVTLRDTWAGTGAANES